MKILCELLWLQKIEHQVAKPGGIDTIRASAQHSIDADHNCTACWDCYCLNWLKRHNLWEK